MYFAVEGVIYSHFPQKLMHDTSKRQVTKNIVVQWPRFNVHGVAVFGFFLFLIKNVALATSS